MEKPIRILHWGLLGGRGGIETFIMNLYRNIDRRKVQFDFLENHDLGRLVYEDEIERMGGRVFRILYSQRENYQKARTCFINFLKDHPEIVGVHVHANFLYAKLLKDAKKVGIPIRILHSHNSAAEAEKSIKEKIRNYIVRKQIAKYPTAYFACSDIAADFMFPNKKYLWIKNGIDVQQYDYNPQIRQKIRETMGLGNEILIGFVGNLRTQKNPFFMIDVFEQFYKSNPDSKLLVVGSGILEQEIKHYVHSKKLDDFVIFLGTIPNVYEMYQAMDAFLLPSFYEGLPVVLVEAQAAGLPCFVSDHITQQIGVTEYIKYLSLESSPSQWAQMMQNTLDGFIREGGKKEVVKSGFDIKNVAAEVQNYYLSHIKSRRNQSG